jgi:hypothetical protein
MQNHDDDKRTYGFLPSDEHLSLYERLSRYYKRICLDTSDTGIRNAAETKLLNDFALFEDDIKPKVAQKIKINKYKNIFLATDEKFFYDELKKNFKKNNIKFNSAINKKNVSHWDQVYSNEKNKTILGEDAIIDSIILSKCDYSLLSRSNLSVTSILLRDDYNFSFLDEHLL